MEYLVGFLVGMFIGGIGTALYMKSKVVIEKTGTSSGTTNTSTGKGDIKNPK
jgi:hypothetical protein